MFQGFYFFQNPHFFGNIKQFRRAKSWSFFDCLKIDHELHYKSLIVLSLRMC